MSLTTQNFMATFAGRTDAFGTGTGGWVHRAPEVPDFEAHLAGRGAGIGIAPLRDDGTVTFAAIDLDEPDFGAARRMQEFIPGDSWVERSRSGNAHVWVFFTEPIEAWVARGILRVATEAAGKFRVEVFPKQDRLLPGMLGNYINLPYHGTDRPVLYGDDPYPIEDFLAGAVRTACDPADWRKRARWLDIHPPGDRERTAEFGTRTHLHRCAEYIIANREENPIVEGHRATVYFNLAKMLLNWEAINDDEAYEYLDLVNQASPDPVHDGELRRSLRNAAARGLTSTGCDDPLMGPYVDPDCPIAKGNR